MYKASSRRFEQSNDLEQNNLPDVILSEESRNRQEILHFVQDDNLDSVTAFFRRVV